MAKTATKKKASPKLEAVPAPILVKLDLGCGKNKKEGHVGVDIRKFEGVDVVADLSHGRWPWADSSVDEVNASHFVEHLDATERIHFVNELWRVLKKDAKANIVTPHWNSARAYGDLTHKWPPVCEFWFQYLDKKWRATEAPHNDKYTCDFHVGYGYSLRPDLTIRNDEYKQYALGNFKEAAQDMLATMTAKKD